MTMDPKIIRAAHRLIDKHGTGARKHAKRWAEECRAEKDEDGLRTWQLIVRAVDELLSDDIPDDSSIN